MDMLLLRLMIWLISICKCCRLSLSSCVWHTAVRGSDKTYSLSLLCRLFCYYLFIFFVAKLSLIMLLARCHCVVAIFELIGRFLFDFFVACEFKSNQIYIRLIEWVFCLRFLSLQSNLYPVRRPIAMSIFKHMVHDLHCPRAVVCLRIIECLSISIDLDAWIVVVCTGTLAYDRNAQREQLGNTLPIEFWLRKLIKSVIDSYSIGFFLHTSAMLKSFDSLKSKSNTERSIQLDSFYSILLSQ